MLESLSDNPHPAPLPLLKQRLSELLQIIRKHLSSDLTEDIERALREPGKLLSLSLTAQPSIKTWSNIPWLIANYLDSNMDVQFISGIAVLFEVYICAFDLADDVQDEDMTDMTKTLGMPRVSLLSFTLFEAVYFALTSGFLKFSSEKQQIEVLQLMTTLTLRAFNGQYYDLLVHQQAQLLDKEQYLEMIKQKSGSLMSLAFSLGARCASVDPVTEGHFAGIGEKFGVIHQIANDLAGMDDLTKRDAQHKQTLPFILASEIQQKNSLIDEEEALRRGEQATRSIEHLLHAELTERWKEIEQIYGVSSDLRWLLGIDLQA